MPVRLSNLRDNTKDIRIDFGEDGDLNVTVWPHRFTQKTIDAYQAAAEDKDYDLMAAQMATFIESWDLLGEDDEPIPFTGEALETTSSAVLSAVFTRIGEVLSDGPKSRKKSGR